MLKSLKKTKDNDWLFETISILTNYWFVLVLLFNQGYLVEE